MSPTHVSGGVLLQFKILPFSGTAPSFSETITAPALRDYAVAQLSFTETSHRKELEEEMKKTVALVSADEIAAVLGASQLPKDAAKVIGASLVMMKAFLQTVLLLHTRSYPTIWQNQLSYLSNTAIDFSTHSSIKSILLSGLEQWEDRTGKQFEEKGFIDKLLLIQDTLILTATDLLLVQLPPLVGEENTLFTVTRLLQTLGAPDMLGKLWRNEVLTPDLAEVFTRLAKMIVRGVTAQPLTVIPEEADERLTSATLERIAAISEGTDTVFEKFAARYKPVIDLAVADFIGGVGHSPSASLEKAMDYACTGTGKRARPLLFLAVYFALGGKKEALPGVLPMAAAIEEMHSFSLVHDDIQDKDTLRRGELTTWAKFGPMEGALAGYGLLMHCLETALSGLSRSYPLSKVIAAVHALCKGNGFEGMAGGQWMDIVGSAKLGDRSYLEQMHRLKTGAAITTSVVLPAILDGTSDAVTEALTRFGDLIGLLFQITDDILDVTGSEKELGKTPGKDIKEKKFTYITIFMEERRRELEMTETLPEQDAVTRAKAIAEETAQQAIKALEPLKPDYDTTLLEDVTIKILKRKS